MTCRGGASDCLEMRDIGLVMMRGRCKIYVVEGQSLPESERLDWTMRQKLSRLSVRLSTNGQVTICIFSLSDYFE